MKKIILLLLPLLVGVNISPQIRTSQALNQSTINSATPFLDASSSTINNANASYGKGLVFPRTDLTALSLIASPNGIGTSYPGRLDGMIVYNTATGTAASGTAGVSVTPGFYYYDNKSATLNGGTWKPFSPSSAAALGAWSLGGNGAEVTTANNQIGTKTGTDIPVQLISNGNVVQTFGKSGDASFNKVVINPNASTSVSMATKAKTVGGTSFDFALEVGGKGWFENGIVTSASTYPDYVFDNYFTGTSKVNPTYQFKSLAETEKFIKENNHLPGVTKIDDLAKGGNGYMIDATQLSVQSLEKIEELYLHTIEQQKQIDELKAQVAELKALLKK